MRFSGFEPIKTALKDIPKTLDANGRRALEEVGQDLQNQAIFRAPLDLGALRGSGYIETHRLKSMVTVGFAERYALRMHEDMEYTPQEPGTGPKYLTGPLKEREERYHKHITDAIRIDRR